MTIVMATIHVRRSEIPPCMCINKYYVYTYLCTNCVHVRMQHTMYYGQYTVTTKR